MTYFLFAALGVDPFVSIPVAAGVLFLFGYVLQRLLINRVIASGVFMTLVFTFGLSLFLIDMALVLFSGDYRSVTTSYAGAGVVLGDAVIPYQRAAAFAVSVLAVAVLQLFLVAPVPGARSAPRFSIATRRGRSASMSCTSTP